MVLIDLQKPPSESMQRWFGVSLAGFLLLLGFLFGNLSGVLQSVLWIAAAVVAAIYYCLPQNQVPIIRTWQYLTFPLAWLVGHLLLALTFYGVFLPIGWVLRLTGYDPLKLRKASDASDWVPRSKKNVARYFRQF